MKKALLALSLVLIFTSVTFAQGIGLNAIAGKASLLLPQEDGLETGFAIGAVVDLGEIADGVGLFPIIAYEMPGTEFDGFDFSNIQLGADVHYGINENVYVGGGLSLNFASSEVTINLGPFGGEQTVSDSETRFGISLLGGYGFDMGNMDGAVEGRFDIVEDYNHIEIAFLIFFPMNK